MSKQVENFEVMQVKRSQIKTADYNPRTITAEATKALGKVLAKFGMVQPIVVNKTTWTVVGGHQRLAWIDKQQKYTGDATKDYTLTIAAVELDEKAERELNIALNSTTVTGEFDLDKVAEMIEDYQLDYQACGFNDTDLNFLGITVDTQAITDAATPDYIEEVKSVETLAQERAERTAAVKGEKERINQTVQSRYEDDAPYFTVTFSDTKAKEAFLNRFGFEDVEAMFVKGEVLTRSIEKVMK